jgi:peptidoglycan/xylan/chitin deacetylase (PgdA/CDA1 family)
MKTQKFLLFTSVLVLSTACADPFKVMVIKSLEESMNKTITEANDENLTREQIESSPNSAEHVFDQARNLDWEEVNEKICEKLLNMPADDLKVFESEAMHPKNAETVKKCREQVAKKAENAWEEERKQMQQEGSVTLRGPVYQTDDPEYNQPKDTSDPQTHSPIDLNGHEDIILNTKVKRVSNIPGRTTINGEVGPKELVLTFDDGPNPIYTLKILEILDQVGAKVNFFMMGQNAVAYPNIVKMVGSKGHSVGSHSYSHPYMGQWNAKTCASGKTKCVNSEAAKNEIKRAHSAIFKVLGWIDPFFRFPYGASVKSVKSFVHENQMIDFFWNIDSLDWKSKWSAKKMLNHVISGIDKQKRGIVLFHDIQRKTVEALPEFLRLISDRGYKLVVIMPEDLNVRMSHPIVSPEISLK